MSINKEFPQSLTSSCLFIGLMHPVNVDGKPNFSACKRQHVLPELLGAWPLPLSGSNETVEAGITQESI